MIDDDPQFGLFIDELDSDRKLSLKEEKVVSEIVVRQKSEAAIEIIPEEVVICFLLKNMSDTDELGMRGESFEVGVDLVVD